MTEHYGFRFDRDAEGAFYVKQRAEGGEVVALSDVAQDHRRFATWQEAQGPALAWEEEANNGPRRQVCSQYQERRLDGVWAHLELHPNVGTCLVRDKDCRDRARLDALISGAAEAIERFSEDDLEAHADALRS